MVDGNRQWLWQLDVNQIQDAGMNESCSRFKDNVKYWKANSHRTAWGANGEERAAQDRSRGGSES